MQPHIIPNLPGQQRMLFGGIVPNQQNGWRMEYVTHAGGGSRFALKRRSQGREVGGAVMVDVVGLQYHARELLQQVILFVGSAVRTHDSDRLPAVLLAGFLEALSDQ